MSRTVSPIPFVTTPNGIAVYTSDFSDYPHHATIELPSGYPVDGDGWCQVAYALTWHYAPWAQKVHGIWGLTCIPGRSGASWIDVSYLGDTPDSARHGGRALHAIWLANATQALVVSCDDDAIRVSPEDLPADPSARRVTLEHIARASGQPMIDVLSSYLLPVRTDWPRRNPGWKPLAGEELALAIVNPDRTHTETEVFTGPVDVYPDIMESLRSLAVAGN